VGADTGGEAVAPGVDVLLRGTVSLDPEGAAIEARAALGEGVGEGDVPHPAARPITASRANHTDQRTVMRPW
jgi:hypothetical protein